MAKSKMSRARRKKIAIWSTILVLSLSLALPLASYSVHWLGMSATAQEAKAVQNPKNKFWNQVRDGAAGYSAVKGDGANVLMQPGGENWRQFRESPILTMVPWLIVGMAVLLLLYHLLHGKNRLDVNSLSGRMVPRWSTFERMVHWVTAFSFIALAITGLSMLLGKKILIPVLGKAGFASWAAISLNVHNIIGPIFTIGIALMIIMWIWHNFPNATDLKWFAKGGGLFGKAHPSAGRMNGGEKVWFWILMTLGVAVCISGVILVAPIYPQITIPGLETARSLMQQASSVHAIAAVIWTAIALGHIYIGTAGTEGAIEGMATGYVSEEWARQHHDLWFDKMQQEGKVLLPGEPRGAQSQPGTVYSRNT
ncbi:MAG: formate dehydrogenase subunit gamma [Gammaproteobacteria bacterium]|nr:formate dehydrogenase subunit gamma [Gammaproteobacteria bacterium]